MRILHLAAHLGGGIGRAHSALVGVMPPRVDQTFLLLQAPADRYVEVVGRCAQVFVGDYRDAARLVREVDVVQVEYWGHPALDECLGRLLRDGDLDFKKIVVWCHVSCLHPPYPPPWLVERADRFVFTSMVSMQPGSCLHGRILASCTPEFSVVNSGFGFTPGPAAPERGGVAYLGTVDFKKLHPEVFDVLDAVDIGVPVSFWGRTSAEVVAARAAMRHPEGAQLMGYTEAPRDVLSQASVLFYPLRPDHYGTAENALVEAMSLGVVPVVLRNPAECAIVEDGISGVVVDTVTEAAEAARVLITDHIRGWRMALSQGAVTEAGRRAPARSAKMLVELWQGLVSSQQSLVGGLIRKGGHNPAESQVKNRPAAPLAMR